MMWITSVNHVCGVATSLECPLPTDRDEIRMLASGSETPDLPAERTLTLVLHHWVPSSSAPTVVGRERQYCAFRGAPGRDEVKVTIAAAAYALWVKIWGGGGCSGGQYGGRACSGGAGSFVMWS